MFFKSIGVICLSGIVFVGGCWDQRAPIGVDPNLGDTVATDPADPQAGAAAYEANRCNTCHGDDGTGGFAPSIQSVQVSELVVELQGAAGIHAGGRFPDLTDQDFADIAAFLSGGGADVPGAPSGPLHSIDVDGTGILHAQGFSDPTTNCVACHGSDLSGSLLAPSCFSCHGSLWDVGGPPPSHTDLLVSTDVIGAHLPGRSDPSANCASCHQDDLMGRFGVPSCYSCHGSLWDGAPDSPPTHMVVENGVKHAPGLDSPVDNCSSCHGSGLSGTTLIPSCFSCHGPLWSGGGPPPSHTDLLSNGDVVGAHMSGRDSPAANCATCHRADYFGTRIIPACWSCHGSIWDGPPDYPPTHTKVEDGFHHGPGLETPINDCDACHGSDLTGTTLIPSCYSCHGDEWNDDDRR